MKREGRQHGVVSCYRIHPALLSRQRFVKMVDSASTMSLFAKVPSKPTNRSKFTGKCRKPRCNGCHLHPVRKSKAKTKGAMKLKSVDHENELTKYSFGTSATRVLAYLTDDGGYGNDYDYDYDYEDRVEENYNYSYSYDDDSDYDDESSHDIDLRVGFEVGIYVSSVDEYANDVDVGNTDDDDETMSFCDLGLCWGHGDGDDNDNDNDDGWYLVGGQML